MEQYGDLFLRMLKGAPLSVLMALWVFGSMSRKEIMVRTGWKKAAVDDALALLEGLGLIARPHYRKWALADGFQQLPFAHMLPDSESPKNGLAEGEEGAEGPKNGLSASPTSSSSLLLLPKEDPLPTTSSAAQLELACDEAILAVCDEVGIYGDKRQLLAKLPHVIAAGAEYVRGHVAAAGAVSLAIWRMEQGWRMPEGKKDGSDNQIPDEYKGIVKR